MNLYFDYNATTPLAPEALEAMLPYLKENFANPSSSHSSGQKVSKAMREAKRQMVSFLGAADEQEILFTSGGTESNNAALRSALFTTGKKHIVTSAVEHSSIRKLCRELTKEGCRITEIGVDEKGALRLDDLKNALNEDTAIVSLMAANNETGVLFDLAAAEKIVKERGVLFHVDAVQAAGKIPFDLKKTAIDFLSLSAHKFYGPKGAGALYVKKQTPFRTYVLGGSQERGRRAGTENVPGMIGMGAAANWVQAHFEEEKNRQASLQAFFEASIGGRIAQAAVTGNLSPRLANTTHVRFQDVRAETLLIRLDQKGIDASSGSACMSGSQDPSHVLKAMGFSDDEALSGVRFSFGRYTRLEDLKLLLDTLEELVYDLRYKKTAVTSS